MADVATDTDPEAFFRAYYPELYRYISAKSGLPSSDVEDLAQETMVQAWRDRDRFKGQAATRTWLRSIAGNRIRDHHRKSQVRRDSGPVLRALARLHAEELPPSVLDSIELGSKVRLALNRLDEDYARILILRYLEGRSVQEIARRLSESEDAVESRLRRAREAFRRTLEEGGTDDE